jgi:hypothetical protein
VGHLLGAPPGAGSRAGPVTQDAPEGLRWTVVHDLRVHSHSPSPFAGFAFDSPRPGDRTPGAGVEINGWVIGATDPVRDLYTVVDGNSGRTYPLDVARSDVAADYPDSPWALRSGFSFWVPVDDEQSEWTFSLDAEFAFGTSAHLATIRGTVLRNSPQSDADVRAADGPDFVIIGTQRGGTTSLHAYLRQLPDVALPEKKELHYLTDRFERGRDWYLGQFPGERAPGVITGEATPYSMFHPLAPARLKQVAPQAKLIALLRNPVDRAYSHYLMERERGDESLDFAAAIAAEPDRLSGEAMRLERNPSYESFSHKHHSYLARGDYAPQLERWLAAFPREQLLVIRSEDLYEQSAETFARVTEFLELPSAWSGSFKALNKSTGPRMDGALRERLVDHFAPRNATLAKLLGWDPNWR